MDDDKMEQGGVENVQEQEQEEHEKDQSDMFADDLEEYQR